jgi:excinuclease ABC C subunit
VLRRLGHRPGVYRMLGSDGEILYVGKSRDLKKRVSSYFRGTPRPGKTGFLVNLVRDIEVTVTRTEAEALVLENNLIKAHKPRFNVLLKDDKSFPYIRLDTSHAYPRLSFYRGSRRVPGRLFGPYPNVPAVRATLRDLQRLFRIRPCEDNYFAHRSRPCLQYQIERCSGPCVGLISAEDYARDLEHAIRFLEGRGNEIKADLVRRMEAAAEKLAFEEAARYRDQIARLAAIQESAVGGEGGALEADALAVCEQGGVYCVAAMFIRGGRILGSRSWFPRVTAGAELAEVLGAFVAQHYLGGSPPAEILTNLPLEDEALLSKTLAGQVGRQVAVRHRVRAARARWLEMAAENARQSLELRIAGTAGFYAQLAALGEALGLEAPPRRIECFDVSHTGGESTVASCVVFVAEGPLKIRLPPLQHRRGSGGGRLRGPAPGADATLQPDQARGGPHAGSATHRRRRRSAGGGPGGPQRTATRWRRAGRHRQGTDAAPGARAAVLGRPTGATYTAEELWRAAPGTADSRRGAPFRYCGPSPATGQDAPGQPAGGHRGAWPEAPPAAAQRARGNAGGRGGRGRRPREGPGHQPRPGTTYLRRTSSGGLRTCQQG